MGLYLGFLIPQQFSLLNKVLFFLIGGLFLVVLVPENLVYLGVPVKISGWLLLGASLAQVWWCRDKLVAWIRTLYANTDIRTLAVVILLTITFHGVVPIKQGLEWYYGKGFSDQLNYALLAEFLKEEPYSTSEKDIGLRPWLLTTVGFRGSAEQLGMSSGLGMQMTGLKEERIGQSIITAEISVWSVTDGQTGYAATVIFSITVLAICLYVLLRETGVDRFIAGAGALLVALLPAVTRLSLNGFLSQACILFVFPFFASLLRQQDLSARSFTLFFSLTLGYLVAVYSELAPIGFCTFLLGVIFIRSDKFRAKRLMLLSAILLIALMNAFYLRNLLEFLAQQYYIAANAPFLEHMAPKILTLRGWSELIFGTINNSPLASFFDCGTILLGLLFVAGAIFLSRRDRMIFGAILLPVILVISYLATRTSHSSYPIAKIILSILPLLIGLMLVTLSRVSANYQARPIGLLKTFLPALLVAAAAAGSVRYYFEVLDNEGLLRYSREPRFLNVCRELEGINNKRVLIFESHPLLTPWLWYHARHNEVYFDGRFIGAPFSKITDLANVDFVATRERLVDLSAGKVSCVAFVDDTPGEDRRDGHIHYGLGPPANLRFLAMRPLSANLTLRLAPGPEATTFPIDYFLADRQGHVSQGELWGKSVDVRRINLPRGLSTLQLWVKAKANDPSIEPSFPILAELDGIELTDIN